MTPPRALEIVILTAARPGEARLATWAEIDRDAKVRTIPGKRQQADQSRQGVHRVPLSDAAWAVLIKQKALRVGDYIFAARSDVPIAHNAFYGPLGRLKQKGLTAHGFSSTSRC